jgi:hypothetical protein
MKRLLTDAQIAPSRQTRNWDTLLPVTSETISGFILQAAPHSKGGQFHAAIFGSRSRMDRPKIVLVARL